MDYEKQYQEYLARVNRALEAACNAYLPEESEVCRAARYSLLGGGKSGGIGYGTAHDAYQCGLIVYVA